MLDAHFLPSVYGNFLIVLETDDYLTGQIRILNDNTLRRLHLHADRGNAVLLCFHLSVGMDFRYGFIAGSPCAGIGLTVCVNDLQRFLFIFGKIQLRLVQLNLHLIGLLLHFHAAAQPRIFDGNAVCPFYVYSDGCLSGGLGRDRTAGHRCHGGIIA